MQEMERAKPSKHGTWVDGRQQREKAVYQALRQAIGGSDVRFKSAEQEQAIHTVVEGQTPLVIVLPTGGGKSLLFIVPAYLDEVGVTVVVVPFRALINDLVERITDRGIECVEGKPGQIGIAAIVVVSADLAGDIFI